MTQSISPLPVLAPTTTIDDAECFKELAEDMKKLSVAEIVDAKLHLDSLVKE